MDNVKAAKLTALISKLTVAANKAVKKHEPKFDPRKRFSITGLHSSSNFNGRHTSVNAVNLLRG
jgi:hypothetical protein